jgi:dynein heavy chain, axonemal
LINQGWKILNRWKKEWKSTKAKIEEDGAGERWEFQIHAMTNRVDPMLVVLKDLGNIAETLKKFLVFLGPNLKSVTGNSEGIDELVTDVKDLVKVFIDHQFNDFIKSTSS